MVRDCNHSDSLSLLQHCWMQGDTEKLIFNVLAERFVLSHPITQPQAWSLSRSLPWYQKMTAPVIPATRFSHYFCSVCCSTQLYKEVGPLTKKKKASLTSQWLDNPIVEQQWTKGEASSRQMLSSIQIPKGKWNWAVLGTGCKAEESC